MLKRMLAALLCLACLTACAAAEGLSGIGLLPTVDPILPADELTLATFGSDLALELRFTKQTLQTAHPLNGSEAEEGYAYLILDFEIGNYDLADYVLADSVSARLDYAGAFTYDAECVFEKESLPMLVDTTGCFIFSLPGAVAADNTGKLVLELTISDSVSSAYIDVSGEALALGFTPAEAAATGLTVTPAGEKICLAWNGQQDDTYRYIVVTAEAFNNSVTPRTVAESIAASLTYRGVYIYPAAVESAKPVIDPMATQTVQLVFRVPYLVAFDQRGTMNVSITADGVPQSFVPDLEASMPHTHAYVKYMEKISWEDARKKCEDLGGHLVTITSQAESDFVNALVGRNEGPWLGAYADENRQWHWITGEPFEFTNWYKTEPDDKNGTQMYLAYYNSDHQWGDFVLSGKSSRWNIDGFICEWESADACPEESPAVLEVDDQRMGAEPDFRYEALTAQEGLQAAIAGYRSYLNLTNGYDDSYRDLVMELKVINRGLTRMSLDGTVQAALDFRGRYTFDPAVTYLTDALDALEVGDVRLTFRLPSMVLKAKDADVNLTLTVDGQAVGTESFQVSRCAEARHAYAVIRERVDWEPAKAACAALGGYLVTITDAAENAFVQSLYPKKEKYWYGGYADQDRNWYWVTGEPFVYADWGSGEPNNYNRKQYWLASYDGQFADSTSQASEWSKSGYICEWDDVSLVPEGVEYQVFE